MDTMKFGRVILCLALQIIYVSSSTDFSKGNDYSELLDALQHLQLPANDQTEPNKIPTSHEDITQENRLEPADTNSLYDEETNIKPEGSSQRFLKSKRGWEELQRGWRSYFPKRAWHVIQGYWKRPDFRSVYKNLVGKRNSEALVEVPVQPESDNDRWMIDEVGYKLDNNNKVIPEIFPTESKMTKMKLKSDSLSSNAHPLKRGWEDIRLFPTSFTRKRGLDGRTIFANNQPLKRGWEDVHLSAYGRPMKRVSKNVNVAANDQQTNTMFEDSQLSANDQHIKRGWEDVNLFLNGRNMKRGWEDVRFSQYGRFGKRGWEDVRLFANAQIGNDKWNSFRYFPGARRGKRGWEDVHLFHKGPAGKRGWEDVNLFRHYNKLGKRGWEDVRLFGNDHVGKR